MTFPEILPFIIVAIALTGFFFLFIMMIRELRAIRRKKLARQNMTELDKYMELFEIYADFNTSLVKLQKDADNVWHVKFQQRLFKLFPSLWLKLYANR